MIQAGKGTDALTSGGAEIGVGVATPPPMRRFLRAAAGRAAVIANLSRVNSRASVRSL
jgi:hypothetical protein